MMCKTEMSITVKKNRKECKISHKRCPIFPFPTCEGLVGFLVCGSAPASGILLNRAPQELFGCRKGAHVPLGTWEGARGGSRRRRKPGTPTLA